MQRRGSVRLGYVDDGALLGESPFASRSALPGATWPARISNPHLQYLPYYKANGWNLPTAPSQLSSSVSRDASDAHHPLLYQVIASAPDVAQTFALNA